MRCSAGHVLFLFGVLVLLSSACLCSTSDAPELNEVSRHGKALLSAEVAQGLSSSSSSLATQDESSRGRAGSSRHGVESSDSSSSEHGSPAAVPSPKSGSSSSHEQESASWAMVLTLALLLLCIFLTYILLISRLKWLPESCATIILGMICGMLMNNQNDPLLYLVGFDPKTFFMYLLPPIIFESGYSLHKGNFFLNLGSILTFAIVGTILSTAVVGFGVHFAGSMGMITPLSMNESFVFGSLISAVDPVATLAIFSALDVNPTLYMLVFGESVLNDAVAVVLFRTFVSLSTSEGAGPVAFLIEFAMVSVSSVIVGVVVGLFSALVFKLSRLHEFPSLETAAMFVFCYMPYLLAESLELSGIMSILFAGIVMSHYTHFNLSPKTQLTLQHFSRTLAFVAETLVFAYLGLSVFTLRHSWEPGFVTVSMILILVGRAVNIFPLSVLVNKHRNIKISRKEQFIMWFSGLRGAIAFSLALNAPGPHQLIVVSSTLGVVLITTFLFGGGTLPVIRWLEQDKPHKNVSVSKNKDRGQPVSTPNGREHEPDHNLNKFELMDKSYLIPIFRINHKDIVAQDQELSRMRSQMFMSVPSNDE